MRSFDERTSSGVPSAVIGAALDRLTSPGRGARGRWRSLPPGAPGPRRPRRGPRSAC
ncbi:hypothetical protein WMF18_11935 [Sorangium sp. So ce315]|uniref:hypothetical protein n=1 Tax=Sorangium sp. So ce315 TaxID=3133299 RepID=UPI003F5EA984